MIYFYLNFYKFNLYLYIISIKVLSNNIDEKFPITFTYRQSSPVAKLSEHSFGTNFGLTVSVNNESDTNL